MDLEYTRQYEAFERHHWWHVARRELIHRFLDQYVFDKGKNEPRWLDIGCGTGVLLSSYNRTKNKLGLEMDGGSVARGRESGLDIRQVGINWNLPEFGTFDLITLCDVVEHVNEDRAAIQSVHAALNEGGTILVTVPALMSLWSNHDVVNHHFRRYDRAGLLAIFPPEKWEILRVSYFCSFLLPAVWIVRKLKNLIHGVGKGEIKSDMKLGFAPVDRMLLAIFRAEGRLMRRDNLPIGSSLILVARKK